MRPGLHHSRKILLLFVCLVAATALQRAGEARSSLTSPEHIAELRERVAQGDMDAVHELGAVLQDDDDPSNDIEGRDLLIRSASAGASNSAFYLAQSYLYGWKPWAQGPDGRADTVEGLKWLRLAGETRAADSQGQDIYHMLGDVYAGNSIGRTISDLVPVDEVEAIKWFRLCAVEFEASCEWRLGNLLLKSPETAVEGFKWLIAAAKAGHAWSQRDLAELYKTGTLVKKDLTLALVWFEVSQRHNNRMGGEATAMFDDVAFEIDALVKALPPEEVARARKMALTIVPTAK